MADDPAGAVPPVAEAAPAQGARDAVVILSDGRRSPASRVEACDFRNPAFLSEFELRRLRLIHDEFVRYLNARLSLSLRMEFGAKVSKITTQSYARFTESLHSPTHICLFKAEPLAGVGILEMSTPLALTVIDRLLGGQGRSERAERSLTEIEIALLEDIVKVVLEEWGRQWKPDQEIRTSIIGHEDNGRYLQTSQRDALMLLLVLEVSLGETAGQIQVALPSYTMEPLVKKMRSKRQGEALPVPSERKAAWNGAFSRISVPVCAQWEAFEVTLREITSLRVGDVIEMPAGMFQQTRLLLNGVPKFIGAVGIDNDCVAVQIAAPMPQLEEESFHAGTH